MSIQNTYLSLDLYKAKKENKYNFTLKIELTKMLQDIFRVFFQDVSLIKRTAPGKACLAKRPHLDYIKQPW